MLGSLIVVNPPQLFFLICNLYASLEVLLLFCDGLRDVLHICFAGLSLDLDQYYYLFKNHPSS